MHRRSSPCPVAARFALEYRDGGGVTAAVSLQELFGLADSRASVAPGCPSRSSSCRRRDGPCRSQTICGASGSAAIRRYGRSSARGIQSTHGPTIPGAPRRPPDHFGAGRVRLTAMFRIVPRAYRRNHGSAVLVELATDRPIRTRNKLHYRIAHWPVWVFAFFIAPGPITFSLFATGLNSTAAIWFAVVAVGTGSRRFSAALGTEPPSFFVERTRPIPFIGASATPWPGATSSATHC